ncbi:MAG: Rpn family recombination-promoting nuclease/putative transposase [Clostridiales bacterium]|nr:Rpn family recombination-promoting nuclease/putative transposase [Clostridiales bacterium]
MTVTEKIDRKHQEDLQRLKGFRLLDDDFLTKCFEGETDCIELVLRIVLDRPDLTVVDVRTQVFVENLLNRSVRLDILATDSAGRKINVEIQRADKGAGRKRARYNSSMMDANLLKKGEDFDELPETWVVFITENDVMGKGQPLYRIERCILGTGEKFEDGSHILYVNGAYRDETPIGRLMHDFSCTNPSDMYYGVLADRVKFFKESKEGITIMCKVMEDMRNESLQEGRKEGMKTAALRMIEAGKYTLEEISEISGLSLDEVKTLKSGENS